MNARTGVAPFLKWPGGKRWLLHHGINIPALGTDATYYEPFLGAGSLFFALQPKRAVLSDVNPHLIAAYRGLRAQPAAVIKRLLLLRPDKETFEQVRRWEPKLQLDRAVRVIYLNRTAFAGLYRENAGGEFNVPFGAYSDRTLCQENILRKASVAIQPAKLSVGPFSEVASSARAGDLVYLDPPYILGHRNNGFVRYNRHLFSWEAQLQLAELAKSLAHRGVHVIASNAAHREVVKLYDDGFFVSYMERKNRLSPNPKYRGVAKEVVFSSYEGAIESTE